MSDLGADLAAYLETAGYGQWKNANPALNTIFLDEFQDLPANQIMIRGAGGIGPIISNDSVTDRPQVQIYIRNTSKATARSNAETIRQALALQIGVIRQHIHTLDDQPIYLRKDDSNRYIFVLRFQIFGNDT
ncbi:MAG TPA: minor capsid protein [Methanothrix sp.]|nr:minor capsid protein [Methanothrix sp.]